MLQVGEHLHFVSQWQLI